MPREIQTPSTTPSIDRLELSATTVRGTAPSTPGYCTPPCACAEVEPSVPFSTPACSFADVD